MKRLMRKLDIVIINWLQTLEVPLARIAIFIVYFWFGSLKLLGVSPAAPLVQALFERTITFMPFGVFYFLFSLFEVLIGVLFLIRGMERAAILLLLLHLITTAMPLIFLPHITWQAFLVPTIEGQYIIKHILIAASAVVVGSKVVRFSGRS